MKISQEQKTENRRAIIRSAVELISEKGFKSTTMRGIANSAGMGEATIYNYFPTKETILYAYYQDHVQACIGILQQVEDFHAFSLQEQLQTLFDTSLNLFLPDRTFVSETFHQVLFGGSGDWSRIKPIRTAFLSAIDDMLAAASEVGEIPAQVFGELISQFFMDAYIGAVHYWLADTSKDFTNTSILIDRGLDLACALLKAGIANKIFDITIFMFKTHILPRLDHFFDPLPTAFKVKRRFMEAMDEK
jgi:AcrR family transcriptional regulator